jgi:Lon protease-like protein
MEHNRHLDMERLPLFPLNTVLFPGMLLHLHIFEERYQLMIMRCLEKRVPFGVVMIRSGSEVEGFGPSAEPYLIGCTAHITQVQELGDGRKNIVAVGHERFEIVQQHYDEPYLTGDVRVLLLQHPSDLELRTQSRQLRATLEQYLTSLQQIDNANAERPDLPRDPLSLIYLAASILRIPASEKQVLLGENDALRLVLSLRALYRREVTLLDIMAAPVAPETSVGPFSLN